VFSHEPKRGLHQPGESRRSRDEHEVSSIRVTFINSLYLWIDKTRYFIIKFGVIELLMIRN